MADVLQNRAMLVLLLGSLCIGCTSQRTTLIASPEGPNFIVVLADDLGYGDLGCYGNPAIRTPHLDRFAAEGVRFTQCYSAAPVCSPARAGLLTGRTPYRAGVHGAIPWGSPMHLPAGEITIAQLLRGRGYATAQVGKWHLSGGFHLTDQPNPSDHGFDYWFSTQNNALPSHHNPDNFFRNGEPVGPLEGYAASIVVDEAIRWLGAVRDRRKPFLLYIGFHEPHEPIATDPRFAGLYDYPDNPSRAVYYGNVTQMDDAFGRLMASVDELGLRDNTLVLFTSDNGPARTPWHPHGSSGPLREKKGHLYEGGIRVPGMIRWPGKANPGSVCDEPVSGVDLLPTVSQITGIAAPADRPLDGASIVPVLRGRPVERRVPLYWQYHDAPSAPKLALRMRDWKMLAALDDPRLKSAGNIRPEMYEAWRAVEPSGFELYHLGADVGESRDLAAGESSRAREICDTLTRLYRQVRHESPTWPQFQDSRYELQRITWPQYEPKSRPSVPTDP